MGELRIKIEPEEAPLFLERLPGEPQMYLDLADRFLEHLDSVDKLAPSDKEDQLGGH